jgi:hypothetical protein
MSFVYPPASSVARMQPPYLVAENDFYRLWSIDDGSWGFYGYCPTYMKSSDVNKKYNNLHYYWDSDNNIFKITYNNYEGVFDKQNYKKMSKYLTVSYNKQIMFCEIIKQIELKELTDKYAIFEYEQIQKNENNFETINMQFKLLNVDFEYIKNIDENTIKINDNIKKVYEDGIISRLEILNESRCDY